MHCLLSVCPKILEKVTRKNSYLRNRLTWGHQILYGGEKCRGQSSRSLLMLKKRQVGSGQRQVALFLYFSYTCAEGEEETKC